MGHLFLQEDCGGEGNEVQISCITGPFVKANDHIDISVNMKGRDSDVKKTRNAKWQVRNSLETFEDECWHQ